MKNKLFEIDGKLYKIYTCFWDVVNAKELRRNTMRPKMYSSFIQFPLETILPHIITKQK